MRPLPKPSAGNNRDTKNVGKHASGKGAHVRRVWIDLFALTSSVPCSLIFGEQLDIHFGGDDLKFPHHECEIAQSEAYFNTNQWTNYWVHSGNNTNQWTNHWIHSGNNTNQWTNYWVHSGNYTNQWTNHWIHSGNNTNQLTNHWIHSGNNSNYWIHSGNNSNYWVHSGNNSNHWIHSGNNTNQWTNH